MFFSIDRINGPENMYIGIRLKEAQEKKRMKKYYYCGLLPIKPEYRHSCLLHSLIQYFVSHSIFSVDETSSKRLWSAPRFL